jgi:hypothetical protein
MWTVLVLMGLLSGGPWVLVSQIARQACQGLTCRPFPGQAGRQERLVQTFATAEECFRVREQLVQHVEAALAPVNQLVEARHPALALRTSTTFLCRPDTGTTGEQLP